MSLFLFIVHSTQRGHSISSSGFMLALLHRGGSFSMFSLVLILITFRLNAQACNTEQTNWYTTHYRGPLLCSKSQGSTVFSWSSPLRPFCYNGARRQELTMHGCRTIATCIHAWLQDNSYIYMHAHSSFHELPNKDTSWFGFGVWGLGFGLWLWLELIVLQMSCLTYTCMLIEE